MAANHLPLTFSQALRLRVRAQCLPAGRALHSGPALAGHLCGLQAQDVAAGTLSCRPRTAGLTAADVDHARNHERTLVRTWVMRNTLHFVAAEDVRWLLALLSPRAIRQSEHRRAQLGLTPPVVDRAIDLLRTLLQAGPLLRSELIARLKARGLPTEGQAGIHLLARAALGGVICYGPDAGKQQTFVLLDEWLRGIPPVAPPDLLAALARRYLAAYAPATVQDFAAWAGLTLTDARAAFDALGDALVHMSIEGEAAVMLAAQSGGLDAPNGEETVVRLLPAYDTYLLGWRTRNRFITTGYAQRIHPGGGILHPGVLVDGRIVGRWKSDRRRQHLNVQVELFEPCGPGVRAALQAEAQDIGRFLGEEARLELSQVG